MSKLKKHFDHYQKNKSDKAGVFATFELKDYDKFVNETMNKLQELDKSDISPADKTTQYYKHIIDYLNSKSAELHVYNENVSSLMLLKLMFTLFDNLDDNQKLDFVNLLRITGNLHD